MSLLVVVTISLPITILSSTDYLSFGKERIQTGTQAVRKYIGEELDQTTGLNYLNARYYNSNNGQFTSQDPVFWQLGTSENGKKALLNPQSQNSYSYSLNNPLTYKDPDGEFAFPALIVALPAIETGLGYLGAAAATYYTAQTAATLAGTALSGAPQEYKNQVYQDVAENWGAGLSVGAGLTSAVSGISKVGVTAENRANKTYQVYEKVNPATGQVYVGRTSGTKLNVKTRDYNHHMNEKGFNTAGLKYSSSEYDAIRGQEQLSIDKYRSQGISGNSINGISPHNINLGRYINAALKLFGKNQ